MMDWTAVGTAVGGILVGAGGVVSWVVRSRKPAPGPAPDAVNRVNGHPCALHGGLVGSITEIRESAEAHHKDQQAGIDRIHARIDDLYRDLVRDRR